MDSNASSIFGLQMFLGHQWPDLEHEVFMVYDTYPQILAKVEHVGNGKLRFFLWPPSLQAN